MTDLVIRPTRKFIRAAYIASIIVIAAAFFAQQQLFPDAPWWTTLTLSILLFWTAARHLRRLSTRVTITTDKLRCETGLMSKSTRTIQLPKIQDVRVDQSFLQRLTGVGTISIETAGEASRLVVNDIDRPQELADEIMRRAEHQ